MNENEIEEVLPFLEFIKEGEINRILYAFLHFMEINELEPEMFDDHLDFSTLTIDDEVEEILPFLEYIKCNHKSVEMLESERLTLTVNDEAEEILPFLEYVRGNHKGIEMSESEYSTLTVNDEAEEILPFLEYVKYNKNEMKTLESEFLSLEIEEELDDISPFLKFVQSEQETLQTNFSLLETDYESENVFAFAELLSCSR